GFRQVPVASLKLIEQARVLDSDHRLVGEGLEHGDLALGEHRGLGARDADRSYRIAIQKHGHRHDAAKSGRLSDPLQTVIYILPSIRDVDDRSRENSAGAAPAASARRHREGSMDRFTRFAAIAF